MSTSDRQAPQPPYRGAAFTHWLNLGVLAGGLLGSVTIDPAIGLALIPIEAAVLWIVPDLPPYRKWVERNHGARELIRERTFYMEQLWEMREVPKPSGLKRVMSWFAEPAQLDNPDERIVNNKSIECQRYLEMRHIVERLRELQHVRGARITDVEINRFEQVINGYLRLLIACRPLAQALARIDEKALKRDQAVTEERLKNADPAVRGVLLERQRLIEAQLERLPRLQATLELFRTRAEAIFYQLHNVHSQVLADPGMDVNAMLDEVVTRNDIMVDPLGQLESDLMVQEMLERGPGKESGASEERESEAEERNRGAQAGTQRTGH